MSRQCKQKPFIRKSKRSETNTTNYTSYVTKKIFVLFSFLFGNILLRQNARAKLIHSASAGLMSTESLLPGLHWNQNLKKYPGPVKRCGMHFLSAYLSAY